MAANTTKKGIKNSSKRTTIASYFQPRVSVSNTSPSSGVITRTLESTKEAKALQQEEKPSGDQQSALSSQWIILDSVHHSDSKKMISVVKNTPRCSPKAPHSHSGSKAPHSHSGSKAPRSHTGSKSPHSHSGSKPKKHQKTSSPSASFQQQRSPLQDGQTRELKANSPAVGKSTVNEPKSTAKQCQTLGQKKSPYFSSSHGSSSSAKPQIPNGLSKASIVRKELSYSPIGEDPISSKDRHTLKHDTKRPDISRDKSYQSDGLKSHSKDRPRKEQILSGVTLLTPSKSSESSGVLGGTPAKLTTPSKKSFIPSNLSRPSIDDLRSKGKSTLYGGPKSPYYTPPSSPLLPKSAAVSCHTPPSSPVSRKKPPPLTPGKISAVVSPNAPSYSPLTPCSPSSLRIKSPASQMGLSSTQLPGAKPVGSHTVPLSSSLSATGPPSPLLLSSKNLSIFSQSSPPSSPLSLVKKSLTMPPLPTGRMSPTVSLPSTPKSVSSPTSVSSSPPITTLHSPNRKSPLSLKKSLSRKGRVTTYAKVQETASVKYSSSPLHSTEILSKKTCSLAAGSLVKDEPVSLESAARNTEVVIKTEDSIQKKHSHDSEGTSSCAAVSKRRRSSEHRKSNKRKHGSDSLKSVKRERPDYIYCGSPPQKKSRIVVDLTHPSSYLIDLTLSSDSDGDRAKERKKTSDYLVTRDSDRTPELLLSRSSTPDSTSSSVRKSVSVKRKTLFKFPSPDHSVGSRMETTPPLQNDLVTPTLQGVENNEVANGAASASRVVKVEGGSGTRCRESGYGSIGSELDTSSTDAGSTDAGSTDADTANRESGRVCMGEEDNVLSEVKLDSDDAAIHDCPTVVSSSKHKVEKGVDPYSVYLDTEDVFLIEKLLTGLEDDNSSNPLDLAQQPGWKTTPLHEVRVVMGMRKLRYPQASSSSVVRLLSSAQENVISNLLDEYDRLSSYRLCSLLEHLTLVTVPSRMLRAEVLSNLWDMLYKLQEDKKPKKPGLLDREVSGLWWGYFRQLLSIHPPGQHELVDQQYAQFIKTLNCKKEPGFCLWEHIETLLTSRSFLGTFMVDLLVADFWAALSFKRSDPPLFLSVFWSSSSATHVTTPIRGLVGGVARLMQPTPTGSIEETAHLKDLMDLVFLVGTVCSDLATELLIACKDLPHKKLMSFLSALHSYSLYKRLLGHLPDVKKTHMIYASMFNPACGTFANSVKPVKLVPTRVQKPKKKKKSVKPPRSLSVSGNSNAGLPHSASSSSGSCIGGKVKGRSVSESEGRSSKSCDGGGNGIIKKRKLFQEAGHSDMREKISPKSTHNSGNRCPPTHKNPPPTHKSGTSHLPPHKHRNGSWPLCDENQPTHERVAQPSTYNHTSGHRDRVRSYLPSGPGDRHPNRTHSKDTTRDGSHLPIRPPTNNPPKPRKRHPSLDGIYSPTERKRPPNLDGIYSPTERKRPPNLDGIYSPTERKRPPNLDGIYSPTERKRPPNHDGIYSPTERKRPCVYGEIYPPTQRKHPSTHNSIHSPIYNGRPPTHGHSPIRRKDPPTRDRIFPSFHDKDRPPHRFQ